MANSIDYYISGVWFDKNSKDISHVYLHEKSGDGFKISGDKISTADVVKKLSTKTIFTMEWDYKSSEWIIGAEVDTEIVSGKVFLRTVKDGTKINNLRHLLNMDFTPI